METIWKELYEAARSKLAPKQISDYISGGEVAAAVLSSSGKIYTGVCIDTCSTLGICAERNAIFNPERLAVPAASLWSSSCPESTRT